MTELPPLLPPLVVGIYDGDRLVRTVEMEDPRVKFCATFNDLRRLDSDHVAKYVPHMPGWIAAKFRKAADMLLDFAAGKGDDA